MVRELLSPDKVSVSSGHICSALAGDSILTPGWDPSVAPGVKGSLKSLNLVLRLWKCPSII